MTAPAPKPVLKVWPCLDCACVHLGVACERGSVVVVADLDKTLATELVLDLTAAIARMDALERDVARARELDCEGLA